jgi:hypothetical protein
MTKIIKIDTNLYRADIGKYLGWGNTPKKAEQDAKAKKLSRKVWEIKKEGYYYENE